jgi:hypothetical protein
MKNNIKYLPAGATLALGFALGGLLNSSGDQLFFGK